MIRSKRDAYRLVKKAERNRVGINRTRWYSTVRTVSHGEAIVDTWAVKSFKGKPTIMWASEFHTNGRKNKVSGRCLIHWMGGHYFNWFGLGGKSHLAVWSDVDAYVNDVCEQNEHSFGKGSEFYGEYLNGFEDTKYKYAQFEKSGMRISDFLDCYRVSPMVECLVKAGLRQWLTPTRVKSLMKNRPLMRYVARHATQLANLPPSIVKSLYKAKGDALNVEEIRWECLVRENGINIPFSSARICAWLRKTGVSAMDLRNHINVVRELGMSLDYEPHVLPRDFAVFSIEARQMLEEMRERKRLEKEAEEELARQREKEARAYARKVIAAWKEQGLVIPKNYSVDIPYTNTECIAEGNAMHNCIGRIVKQEDGVSLFFVRKDELPYIDVSVENGEITEIRYSHNRAVDKNSEDYAVCEKIASVFARKSA